jgi:magnesium-protoporphyrin IX monomethyl ester (oxidative) cyclase
LVKNEKKAKIKLKKEIEKTGPKYIGISANFASIPSALEYANYVKKEFKGNDIKTIFGGPFPTVICESLLNNHACDFVVIGEGEVTSLELIKTLEKKGNLDKVNGIAFEKNKKLILTNRRKLIQNLDTLPVPAYHLIDMKKYMPCRRNPSSVFISSRGCPERCAFCYHGIHGFAFRARSPKNVTEEIDYLVNQFNIRALEIWDDNFALNKKRAYEICDILTKKGYDLILKFLNGLRVDTLTKDLIEKMYKAGTDEISIAPETGDSFILKKINKGFTLKQVENVVKWCKEVGIKVRMFFIVGFPWDTEETIKNTINFSLKLDPYIVNFFKLIPFPGTHVYDYAKQNGFLTYDLMDKPIQEYKGGYWTQKTFISMPWLKDVRIHELWEIAHKKFYFRPRKILSYIYNLNTPTNQMEMTSLMTTLRFGIKACFPRFF